MQLFILSLNHKECAEFMIDKHVSKIIIEAVQMLSSAKRIIDPNDPNTSYDELYKITHVNHPVTIWIRQSLDNYQWTLDMIEAMHNEWKFRYDHPLEKIHASYKIAQKLSLWRPRADQFPVVGLTPFAQAIPDIYKSDNPVNSYRKYYQSEEKQKIATWKKRSKPKWYHFSHIPKIYTDGSCLENPGPGGWAFTVLENNEQWTVVGGENHTTNNRMELQAVIEALDFIQGQEYEIYTDSLLTLNCATGLWKRKSNLDLWNLYDSKSKNKTLNWYWVKAHNEDEFNEYVDKLAKSEAQRLKNEI